MQFIKFHHFKTEVKMSLQQGLNLHSEISKKTYTVLKCIGEGGQGAVYLVNSGSSNQALKWYNIEQSTQDQEKAIRDLILQGPPPGIAGKRFIWPLDIVKNQRTPQFGYLMDLIDTNRFAELGEIWSRRKPQPNFRTLCEASYQLAHSYKALHGSGYCYRDISRGNMLFDPLTGDVLICDNDNIGVFGQSKCQVWGTLDYMAPELVVGSTDEPSTKTDLHSLAVLLFHLWVWHHPMNGEMEYNIRMWDLPAKKKIYGESPVFIFDPKDRRNQLPNDPDYRSAQKRWTYCPASLKSLFTRAFSEGLKNPNQRVTDGEWCKAFQRLKEGAIECQRCKAINIWENPMTQVQCWYCANEISVPPKLGVYQSTGLYYLLLNKDTKILKRHLDPSVVELNANHEIGQVVQNPTTPNVWGIRNFSNSPWIATFADGKVLEIEPTKAVPLNKGLKLNILGVPTEIFA